MTLHYLHEITWLYMTFHELILPYMTLLYLTSPYATLLYLTLPSIMLHCLTLHRLTLHFITLQCVALHACMCIHTGMQTYRQTAMRTTNLMVFRSLPWPISCWLRMHRTVLKDAVLMLCRTDHFLIQKIALGTLGWLWWVWGPWMNECRWMAGVPGSWTWQRAGRRLMMAMNFWSNMRRTKFNVWVDMTALLCDVWVKGVFSSFLPSFAVLIHQF